MKKLLIIAALTAVIPATTFAAGGQFTGGTFTGVAALYVTEDFNLSNSIGVDTYYDQTATELAVASGHPKGTLEGFGGTTNGGSIAQCETGFEGVTAVAIDAVIAVAADANGDGAVSPSDARAVGC